MPLTDDLEKRYLGAVPVFVCVRFIVVKCYIIRIAEMLRSALARNMLFERSNYNDLFLVLSKDKNRNILKMNFRPQGFIKSQCIQSGFTAVEPSVCFC